LPPGVEIYRINGDLDAATATATANPQFGAGGGTRLALGDFPDAVDAGQLVRVGEHSFDPDTLRSDFEDPRYRLVDPSLPIHAVDPDREELLGRWDAAKEHARDNLRNATVVAIDQVAAEPAERGDR
jgi:hypothetical protein